MHVQFISHENLGIEEIGNHGGVGVSQRIVAEGMVARGHQVELVVLSDHDWVTEHNGVRIRAWKPRRDAWRAVANVIRQRRIAFEFAKSAGTEPCATIVPDVCSVTWPYPLATLKVIKFTCTHLLQMYEGNARPRWRTAMAERIMVPRADAFMSISRRTAEVSAHLFKVPLDRIAIIPNAVDTLKFRSDDTVTRDPNLLLYVGTVCEKKGPMDAVGALDLLAARYPRLRMLMIGRDGVGYDHRPHFRARIKDRYAQTCATRVEFQDHVPNDRLPDYYRRAGLVVLPSHYESFGRTTIEAMACGAAVVRSDGPPAAEIIEDRVSGLLCRNKDPEDLARAIAQGLDSADLRTRLGKAARQRVEALYSRDVVAKATEDFLQAAFQRQPRSRAK